MSAIRFPHPFLFLLLLSVALLPLLTGCREGSTVSRESPSFVDKNSAPGIDTGLPSTVDLVVNTSITQGDEDFVPPPSDTYIANATISIDEKQVYVGKDVVKLWVWNERGSQSLLMAEGTGVSLPALKVSVGVPVIGHEDGGAVKVTVNGQYAKTLGLKEETRVGTTWIFVSDIFLNAAQE